MTHPLPMIHCCITTWTTLAVELVPKSRAEEWAKVWPKQPATQDSSLMLWLGILLAIAIVAGVIYHVVYRHTHRVSKPMQVFTHAANHMALDRAERRLLAAIAAYEKLPTPLTLMLCQGTLEHHWDNYARHQPPLRRDKAMTILESIRRKLFSQSAQEIAAMASGSVG